MKSKSGNITKFKVAVIQQAPVFLNLEQSIEKAGILAEDAANKGAGIIAFPETWLPGYPVWLDIAPKAATWDYAPAKALYNILVDNSLKIPGPYFTELLEIAKKTESYIIMGAHELIGGTIYNTMIYLHKNGLDFTVHRKLTPTYNERMIWGQADGSTLNIMNTEFGNIGGLICWEHWMPLARAAMHSKQETIHVAQWPAVKELHQMASRHYAFEGQCFVLAVGSILSRQGIVDGYQSLNIKTSAASEIIDSLPGENQDLILKGGSCIIGPDSSIIAGPVLNNPAILVADIDTGKIAEGHLTLDTSGHYTRPDVFRLEVNDRPQSNVVFQTDNDKNR